MTAADHIDEIALRAERLYAARAAMEDTSRSTLRIGIAEIMQFLNDPRRSLSMEEQRSLFANPQLRADYRRLKSQVAVADLPALAAASVGDVNTRRFEGGTVSIHRSRVADQIYVVLRFDRLPGTLRTLLLENTRGDIIKRTLPAADPNGEILLVLDDKIASDQGFLQLISDPTSTGSFLA
jgi:hypothetical protein